MSPLDLPRDPYLRPRPTTVRERIVDIWDFTRQVFNEWSEDNCFRLSAALSYYTVFSLAPILIIVISTAGAVFGREAVQGQIYTQIRDLIGSQGAEAIESLVQNAYLEPQGGLATIISVVTLMFSATITFAVIQDSLNTIWKVRVRPERSIIKLILARVLSFAMVLGIGFLLMVSLVLNAILVALRGYIAMVLSSYSVYFIAFAQQVTSLGIITLLFALMFKFLPDVRVPWRNVWRASILTAVLFEVGKALIGFYLGRSNLANTYGAAGSVIIIMVWVNYSAWIFFLGAEAIYVYMRRRGEPIIPTSYATRLSIQTFEQDPGRP